MVGNPGGRLGALQPFDESNTVRYRGSIVGPGGLGTAWTIRNGTFAELGANALFRETAETCRGNINGGRVDRRVVVKVVLEDGHGGVGGSSRIGYEPQRRCRPGGGSS